MGQKEFDKLLANVGRMTEAVEKLPDNCREMVYSSLVAELLSVEAPVALQSPSVDKYSNQTLPGDNVEDRNVAEELEQVYRRFSLDSVSDMEFVAVLAYFYAQLAPPAEMSERIDASHYKMACMITGRSLPKRIAGTMNNAKNLKGYLESHGSGVYSITAMGEHYVKHRLLKEGD